MTTSRATPLALTWLLTHVAETGSTNTDLVAAAREGAPFGTVLVAEHQTAGRGRLGRRWEAPSGASLLTSILLPPELGKRGGPQRLTQAVAVAAAEACVEAAGVAPVLKWPNDLLVGGRKLAGVLAESVVVHGQVRAVVVGIGLNVNWPEELPADLASTMTALNREAGHDIDRLAVLDRLLAALARTDPSTLEAAYRARLDTLGREVRVDLGAADVVGTAVDLGPDGELVVEVVGGSRHVVTAGDVVHLRPA